MKTRAIQYSIWVCKNSCQGTWFTKESIKEALPRYKGRNALLVILKIFDNSGSDYITRAVNIK